MSRNAAHAERLWDRLAKRKWFCMLSGPNIDGLPWTFQATKGDKVVTRAATSRVDAIVIGVEAVQEVENGREEGD